MIFHPISVKGAFLVEPEIRDDERGYFARVWCHDEFRQHGLNPKLSQSSVSFNRRKGTLRGMHWQVAPHEEAKLVRCIRGSIFDVVVDLRRQSPTFRVNQGFELSEENGAMLYVPEGCAHGFLTLADDSEVLYFISTDYVPEAQRGFRWNDSAINIAWPGAIQVMSERDRTYPDLAI